MEGIKKPLVLLQDFRSAALLMFPNNSPYATSATSQTFSFLVDFRISAGNLTLWMLWKCMLTLLSNLLACSQDILAFAL